MRNFLTVHILLIIALAASGLAQAGSDAGRASTTEAVAPGGGTMEATALLMVDDPAPDGNGTIIGIGFPTINNSGEIAVVLEFGGTPSPPNDARGIYLVSTESATKLVRGGEPVPDGNGVFRHFAYDLNYFEQVAINDNGDVAFTALLDGTSGGNTDGYGNFGANAVSGVTEYVRLSDPAPDGNGTFGPPDSDPFLRALSPPGLDNQGRASFYGQLKGTAGGESVDDEGIFRADGLSITKLLRIGQPEPFGTSTVEWIEPEYGSNSSGQVAIGANIFFDFMPPGGGVHPDDLERIYIANEFLLEEAFRSGVTPPDGDGIIGGSTQWRTRIADNGNITFWAAVFNTVNPMDEGFRFFHSDGVTLSEVVRRGIGPGETEPFEFTGFPGLDSNSNGEVILSATLERNAVPPDNLTTAIYRWNGSGLTVAVHQGDPAPDGNGTFGRLDVPVFLNEGGQIAFMAAIEGSVLPPGSLADIGIFVVDSSGTIHQAARSGLPLAGSTTLSPQYLGSVALSGFGDSTLQLAGMNAINNAGQLPFVAWLADGRIGLFLWGSPEIFSGGFESGDTSAWSETIP
jgi:hypothetical protein